jgi:hypothetical protein
VTHYPINPAADAIAGDPQGERILPMPAPLRNRLARSVGLIDGRFREFSHGSRLAALPIVPGQ